MGDQETWGGLILPSGLDPPVGAQAQEGDPRDEGFPELMLTLEGVSEAARWLCGDEAPRPGATGASGGLEGESLPQTQVTARTLQEGVRRWELGPGELGDKPQGGRSQNRSRPARDPLGGGMWDAQGKATEAPLPDTVCQVGSRWRLARQERAPVHVGELKCSVLKYDLADAHSSPPWRPVSHLQDRTEVGKISQDTMALCTLLWAAGGAPDLSWPIGPNLSTSTGRRRRKSFAAGFGCENTIGSHLESMRSESAEERVNTQRLNQDKKLSRHKRRRN